jgi:AraC family transcriptional regulator
MSSIATVAGMSAARPQATVPVMTAAMRGAEAALKAERTWRRGALYAAVKSWTGADAELTHRRRHHTLVLTLSGGSDRTETRISGAQPYRGKDRAGSLTFVPSDAERRAWYRNTNLNFLVLLIDPAFAQHCDFGTGDLPPFTNRQDALLKAVLVALSREMLRGAPDLPSLYAEHAAGLAICHLQRSAGRVRPANVSRSGLSDAQMRRLVDFIEANLHRNVSLLELAGLVGIVPDVLARKLKARIGRSPYNYFLERRIRRAETLLHSSGKPIAEIALEVGFSSQSHFTTQFKRIANVTPGAYRAARRD